MKKLILLILLPLLSYGQKQITNFFTSELNNSQTKIIGTSDNSVYFYKLNNKNVIDIFKTEEFKEIKYTLVDSFVPDLNIVQFIEIGKNVFILTSHKDKNHSLWKFDKLKNNLEILIPSTPLVELFAFKNKLMAKKENATYELKVDNKQLPKFIQINPEAFLFPSYSTDFLFYYTVSQDQSIFKLNIKDSLNKNKEFVFKNKNYIKITNIQKLDNEYFISFEKLTKNVVTNYYSELDIVDFTFNPQLETLKFLDENKSLQKYFYRKNNNLASIEVEQLNFPEKIKIQFNVFSNDKKIVTDTASTKFNNFYYPFGPTGPSTTKRYLSDIYFYNNSIYFIGNPNSLLKRFDELVSLIQIDGSENKIREIPIGNLYQMLNSNFNICSYFYSNQKVFKFKTQDNKIKIYPCNENVAFKAFSLETKEFNNLDSLSESSFLSYRISNGKTFAVENNMLYEQNLKERTKKEIKLKTENINVSSIIQTIKKKENLFFLKRDIKNLISLYHFDGKDTLRLAETKYESYYSYLTVFEEIDNKYLIAISGYKDKMPYCELYLYNLVDHNIKFIISSSEIIYSYYNTPISRKIGSYNIFNCDNFIIKINTLNNEVNVVPKEKDYSFHKFISAIGTTGFIFISNSKYYYNDLKTNKNTELKDLENATVLNIKSKSIFFLKYNLLFKLESNLAISQIFKFNSYISNIYNINVNEPEQLLNVSNYQLYYFNAVEEKLQKIQDISNYPLFYKIKNKKIEYAYVKESHNKRFLEFEIFDLKTEKIETKFSKDIEFGRVVFLTSNTKNIVLNQINERLDFYELSQYGIEKVFSQNENGNAFINNLNLPIRDNILITKLFNKNKPEVLLLDLMKIKQGFISIKIDYNEFFDVIYKKNESFIFKLVSNTLNSNKNELWYSDGTEKNTMKISNQVGQEIFIENDNILFSKNDNFIGTELFKFNLKTKKLSNLADINKGMGGSFPQKIFKINQNFYTLAFTPESGEQIWRIDSLKIEPKKFDNLDQTILMYPNPTDKQSVKIEIKNLDVWEPLKIELFSDSGQYITSYNTFNNESVFFNKIAPGIYILKIKVKNQVVSKRLMFR